MTVPKTQRNDNADSYLIGIQLAYIETKRLLRRLPYRSQHGMELRSTIIRLMNEMRENAISANDIFVGSTLEASMRVEMLNKSNLALTNLLRLAEDWVDEPLYVEKDKGRRAVKFDERFIDKYINTLLNSKQRFKKAITMARALLRKLELQRQVLLNNAEVELEKLDKRIEEERAEKAQDAVKTSCYSEKDKRIVDKIKYACKKEGKPVYSINSKLTNNCFSVKHNSAGTEYFNDDSPYFEDEFADLYN